MCLQFFSWVESHNSEIKCAICGGAEWVMTGVDDNDIGQWITETSESGLDCRRLSCLITCSTPDLHAPIDDKRSVLCVVIHAKNDRIPIVWEFDGVIVNLYWSGQEAPYATHWVWKLLDSSANRIG